MIGRVSSVGFVLVLAAAGASASVTVTDRLQNEFPLATGGVVVIDNRNTAGNIDVRGGDEGRVAITSARVIRGADNAGVAEARQVVNRIIEGNDKTRVIRSAGRSTAPRWNVQIHYTVVVPRSANVKVLSSQTSRISVVGVNGNVEVKNVTGPVLINNVGGRVLVENVNGDVTLTTQQVRNSVRLSSVNGSIGVRTAADARFIWEAETVTGEAVTSFEIRNPRFLTPNRFRGTINAESSAAIVMETFSGNVSLLAQGVGAGRSVRSLVPNVPVPSNRRSAGVGPMLPPNPERPDIRLPLVQGHYRYETSIGDVRIDEIRGATRIVTGAGLVNLGSVFGHAEVMSFGGPLTLGEIHGPLVAHTEAGNITVQRAREGGTITTGRGGTIQVVYSGGPTSMSSGGGDIVLRHANGPVKADTKSGDISIAFDSAERSGTVEAKTQKGNILLTLPGNFGADIDAEVFTSDPSVYSIRSDFPGLSVQRDQVGGKTRIRATGKINGGGVRVTLQAHDGGIHIGTDAPRVSPMVPR